jgi:phenylacetate-CoA ligase
MNFSQSQRSLAAFQKFLTTSLNEQLQQSQIHDPEAAVLNLFHAVATTVPAYQAFLQAHDLTPDSIQTFEDFQTLPLLTKDNYHRQYPLTDLCRNGQLSACDMVAVSSGSTGQPTFWPRFLTDELAIATRFEQIFHDSFQANTRRTLAVVCFALGTWVGGMFSASCCRYLASKGYPVTVVTPGNHKPDIFRVLKELAPAFEQVVLLGYPPFLKDIVDSGLAQGVAWPQYNIKLVLAGEVFSEAWRDLMGMRVGSQNLYYDSASLYGTADAGVLGNETPLSICIRRFLAERPELATELFGESRLPTLVQYDPFNRFFEAHEGTLLFSGDNGIPLIRYHICDQGGIIPYERMLQYLARHGFDPIATLKPSGECGVYPLPFVYVFGRSHFTVSYFGANIYPENVTVGLEQSPMCNWVTGKFVLQVQSDADQNPFLLIAVELAPGIGSDPQKQEAIAQSIYANLLRLNSEFANYVPTPYQLPQVELLSAEDPSYFPIGVKHRYTRES